MVMTAEWLARRLGSRTKDYRQRSLEALDEGQHERLHIYEYDNDTGEQIMWQAALPVAELIRHLPVSCRWSPDYPKFRWLWAGLDSLVVFILAFGISLQMVGVVLAPFVGLLFCGIGFAFGYATGHKLTPAPFWTARRLWAKDETTGEQVVSMWPLVHTLLKGEPTLASFSTNGHSNGRLRVAGYDLPPDDVYIPHAERATSLYEDLKMRNEREDMRVPRDTWQKIQIGAVGLLAGGLVLGLIFIIAVTTE